MKLTKEFLRKADVSYSPEWASRKDYHGLTALYNIATGFSKNVKIKKLEIPKVKHIELESDFDSIVAINDQKSRSEAISKLFNKWWPKISIVEMYKYLDEYHIRDGDGRCS